MKKIKLVLYFLLAVGFCLSHISCEEAKDADVEGIELELDFKRLDLVMREAAQAIQAQPEISADSLYRQFFEADKDFYVQYLSLDMPDRNRNRIRPEKYDSLIGVQMKGFLADPMMQQLLDTLTEVIPPDYPIADVVSKPLMRLQLLFPDVQIPKIRTHANGYMRGADLRAADQISSLPGYISFGLHYFMGKDLDFYPENIYAYQRRRFALPYMEVVFAKAIAEEFVAPKNPAKHRSLIAGMVHAGIKQYFVQQLLPYTPDSLCLYYTPEQMAWSEAYEEQNYSFLLDKLFDTDFKFQRNYLADKPFTTELSNSSAPRIGEYLGWKIVEAYMKNNPDVSLAELCENQDYEGIFRAARYKP